MPWSVRCAALHCAAAAGGPGELEPWGLQKQSIARVWTTQQRDRPAAARARRPWHGCIQRARAHLPLPEHLHPPAHARHRGGLEPRPGDAVPLAARAATVEVSWAVACRLHAADAACTSQEQQTPSCAVGWASRFLACLLLSCHSPRLCLLAAGYTEQGEAAAMPAAVALVRELSQACAPADRWLPAGQHDLWDPCNRLLVEGAVKAQSGDGRHSSACALRPSGTAWAPAGRSPGLHAPRPGLDQAPDQSLAKPCYCRPEAREPAGGVVSHRHHSDQAPFDATAAKPAPKSSMHPKREAALKRSAEELAVATHIFLSQAAACASALNCALLAAQAGACRSAVCTHMSAHGVHASTVPHPTPPAAACTPPLLALTPSAGLPHPFHTLPRSPRPAAGPPATHPAPAGGAAPAPEQRRPPARAVRAPPGEPSSRVACRVPAAPLRHTRSQSLASLPTAACPLTCPAGASAAARSLRHPAVEVPGRVGSTPGGAPAWSLGREPRHRAVGAAPRPQLAAQIPRAARGPADLGV